MQQTIISGLLSALFTVFIASLACAEEKENKSSKALEVTKSTKKLEVRESQIGYRDTLLFYTFTDQKAVLKLQIDNKDKSFPMAGTICIFADNVKEDDLNKWLNNQHSDGLFPDVPEPISTHKIPEKFCKVTSNKMIDRSKQEFGEYANYSVAFEVKDYADKNSVTLKGFSDTAKVHVKTK
jgi:hypothetical protein